MGKLLEDPDIREALTAPAGALALATAAIQRDRSERLDQETEALNQGALLRGEEARAHDPGLHAQVEAMRALNDLLRACNAFARATAEALPKVTALPAVDGPLRQGMWLKEANIRAKGAVEQIEALVTTGRPGGDIDRFLHAVLTSAGSTGTAE